MMRKRESKGVGGRERDVERDRERDAHSRYIF